MPRLPRVDGAELLADLHDLAPAEEVLHRRPEGHPANPTPPPPANSLPPPASVGPTGVRSEHCADTGPGTLLPRRWGPGRGPADHITLPLGGDLLTAWHPPGRAF